MKPLFFATLLVGFLMSVTSCDDTSKARVEYCEYIAGDDCECYRPPIASTDIICLPCDSSLSECPNYVRLTIYCPPRGGRRDTCRMTVTRRGSDCVNCPSNKKINKGDYVGVVLSD